MPIQPGLALQLKGLELPDPLAMQAQATQIQNALQQQRIGEMQIQNAMREQRRAQELESIMSGFEPTAPAADVAGRLQKGGFFQQAGQVLQQEATRQKTAREEEQARLNVIKTKAELMGRMFVGVKDQQSYSMARQQAIQRGFGTEQDIPEAYDQATVDNVVKGSIAVIDSMKNELDRRKAAAAEATAKAAGVRAEAATRTAAAAEARAGQEQVPASIREFRATQAMPEAERTAFLASQAAKRPTTTISVGGESLTPLQKKADERFADDYAAWKAGGGVAAAKNVAQIKSVMDQLHEGKQYSGPMLGITPDVVLAFTNPQALDARQRVEQVAQESLRSILGAQFTQKEGEAFIARVYDPKLKPEQNAARLRALFAQLQTAAEQKQAMVDYADEHGTLRGFRGKTPSIADFYEALEVKPLRSGTKRGEAASAEDGGGQRRQLGPGVFVTERP